MLGGVAAICIGTPRPYNPRVANLIRAWEQVKIPFRIEDPGWLGVTKGSEQARYPPLVTAGPDRPPPGPREPAAPWAQPPGQAP